MVDITKVAETAVESWILSVQSALNSFHAVNKALQLANEERSIST